MTDRHREDERGFKIVDRRLFDAEGNPKPAEEASGPTAQTREAPPPRQAERPPPPGPPTEEEAAAAAYHVGEDPEALGPLDFAQFILSVAQLAFAFLGDLPSPQSGRRERNLAAAKQQIDLLGMLREKTEGNRSPDENQLMGSLLYELHRRYVEVVEEQRQATGRRS